MEKHDSLYKIRHSFAHVLAMAVLDTYPDAKIAIGPAIDTGFYYDIDFGEEKISDEHLKDLQKKMKKIAGRGLEFSGTPVTAEEALAHYKNNPYKTELIQEFAAENKELTFYKTGDDFIDLCAGGHVENTKELPLDAFRLDKVAGAYWRGDEKNKMLTRIYGLAFETKEELDTHLKMIEEAKKRDHRKLGKELGLFTFSELVGPGLPLWTPKGTLLRKAIDDFVWELRAEKGYKQVTIPHITKEDLYKTSGHYDKFADELFKVGSREGKNYFLKPMNCPHHTQIFDAEPRSYKDMPQRYAETTMVYRDEQSGELGGLTRVLSITQDDAHVFCREIQIKEEMNAIWDIVEKFYGAFNFTLGVHLSFHDPEEMDKYLGTPEVWASSEGLIEEIAKERGVDYVVDLGEAALYGPKLDFRATDSLGRTHQVATIQLDRNLPERFDLTCINENGEKERIVMIHAAIAGSLERFSGVMIEHTAGNFPLRFSPTQVAVIPIAEPHNEYAQGVNDALVAAGYRTTMNTSKDGFGKKVRAAKKEKLPYFIVIGDQDIEANKVTLESRDTGESEQLSIEEVLTRFNEEVQ